MNREETIDFLLETGQASTLEEAEAIISQESGGKNNSEFPYFPKNLGIMKFFSGHQKSNFAKANKALKMAGKDPVFEEGNYYVDFKIPKVSSGKGIDTDNIEVGVNLGSSPEAIIISKGFSGTRYVPNSPDNISTTIQPSLFKNSQKGMIDPNTGKSVFDMNEELIVEFGSKSDIPQNKKIKYQWNVALLVRAVEGDDWIPAFQQEILISFENDCYYSFFDQNSGFTSNILAQYETEEGEENYSKKLNQVRFLEISEVKEISNKISEVREAYTSFVKEREDCVTA